MTLSPEQKKKLWAKLDKIVGPKPLPKPKVVTQDGFVIRDAEVHVSQADPNAKPEDEIVFVRRDDFVTVNMVEYERQQAEREGDRRLRRHLDPFRIGLYGPIDEDE